MTRNTTPPPARRCAMLEEIHEQPAILEHLLSGRDHAATLDTLRQLKPSMVLFAARGTSAHAAFYGRYLLERYVGTPVTVAALSLFTHYHVHPHLMGTLVIGISQSGEAMDAVEVLGAAQKMGAFTVAITNTAGSPITQVAHEVMLLGAGPEKAVAATKTYTGQLAALLLVTQALGGRLPPGLARIPQFTAQALEQEPLMAYLAPRLRFATRMVILGRAFDYCTVHEAALKLQETCYLAAIGYSAADFLHGPIAMLEEQVPVMVYAPSGRTVPFMNGVLRRLQDIGSETCVVTNQPRLAQAGLARLTVQLAPGLNEVYMPFPHIVLAQVLAAHLALEKGIDPDRPRELSKVTRTL